MPWILCLLLLTRLVNPTIVISTFFFWLGCQSPDPFLVRVSKNPKEISARKAHNFMLICTEVSQSNGSFVAQPGHLWCNLKKYPEKFIGNMNTLLFYAKCSIFIEFGSHFPSAITLKIAIRSAMSGKGMVCWLMFWRVTDVINGDRNQQINILHHRFRWEGGSEG